MKHEVRIRAADHVERLATALVREEVAFEVRPEPNGWWAVRVKAGRAVAFWADLAALSQATALDPAARPLTAEEGA